MIKNTRMIELKKNVDEYGTLVPIEANLDIPFEIRRVYYIYDVNEKQRRGFHSHIDLEQALICVHGSVKILVKTPFEEDIVTLDSPSEALYIGPMVWREMFDFIDGAVLLVLANKHYNADDYIRDKSAYGRLALEYFELRGELL